MTTVTQRIHSLSYASSITQQWSDSTYQLFKRAPSYALVIHLLRALNEQYSNASSCEKDILKTTFERCIADMVKYSMRLDEKFDQTVYSISVYLDELPIEWRDTWNNHILIRPMFTTQQFRMAHEKHMLRFAYSQHMLQYIVHNGTRLQCIVYFLRYHLVMSCADWWFGFTYAFPDPSHATQSYRPNTLFSPPYSECTDRFVQTIMPDRTCAIKSIADCVPMDGSFMKRALELCPYSEHRDYYTAYACCLFNKNSSACFPGIRYLVEHVYKRKYGYPVQFDRPLQRVMSYYERINIQQFRPIDRDMFDRIRLALECENDMIIKSYDAPYALCWCPDLVKRVDMSFDRSLWRQVMNSKNVANMVTNDSQMYHILYVEWDLIRNQCKEVVCRDTVDTVMEYM
jgi:hypothetical protein